MNYSNDDAWADEMLLDLDDELFTESDDESDDEARGEIDDEIYGESEDDFYSPESDDPEFLGTHLIKGVGKAISGVRSLINRRAGSGKRISSFKPGGNFLRHNFGRRTPNISGRSNLSGILNTNRGPFSFKLPPNIATKEDLKKLTASFQVSDKKHEAAIRKNAEAIKGNVAAIRKSNADLKALDKKHSTVELRQNKILDTVNKSVLTLKKDAEQVRQQMQMQAMMSMIMQPKLETIKLKPPKAEGSDKDPDPITYTVEESKFKSDMMPLMFMFMNQPSGGGMNPMMFYFMMQK